MRSNTRYIRRKSKFVYRVWYTCYSWSTRRSSNLSSFHASIFILSPSSRHRMVSNSPFCSKTTSDVSVFPFSRMLTVTPLEYLYDFSDILSTIPIAWLRGGVQPKFYVKLDFEIAVDQKGGTHDQTFEGVPNSQCRIMRTRWPHPILAKKYQIHHTRSKPSKWVLYL